MILYTQRVLSLILSDFLSAGQGNNEIIFSLQKINSNKNSHLY